MRSMPELEDDHRIRRLLNDFDKRYTGQDFNALQNKSSGAAITPDMLDGVRKHYLFAVEISNLPLLCAVVETIFSIVYATFTRNVAFNSSFETWRSHSIWSFRQRHRT